MRKYLFFLAVLIFLAPALRAFAITSPATTIVAPSPSLLTKLSTWKEKDLRKQLGRKLTLKEKIAFFFLKKKARKMAKEYGKAGESAYVAGLIAVGLLLTGLFFVPLLLGSLVAAIVAIASGSKALKHDRGNKKAKTGKLLGWITIVSLIGLIIAILFVIAIFTETFGSLFG